MKKNFLVAAVVALVAAAVSVFFYVNNGKNEMDDFFNANVEALADDEIIVGPLCMQVKNRLCFSLGKYYEDHQRA